MKDNRIWLAATGIVVVALIALGWFLGAAPRFAEASLADQQRAAVESTNLAAQARLGELKEQFTQIDALREELAALRLQIPADVDWANALREISKKATKNKVFLQGISVADVQQFLPGVPPEEAVAAADEEADGDAEDDAPETPAAVPDAPAGPVANFYVIPISLTIESSFADTIRFIGDMQDNERLFLVNDFTVAKAKESSKYQVETTITGYLYVLVDPTGTAVANPTGEEPEPEASATPSPTDSPTPGATETPAP